MVSTEMTVRCNAEAFRKQKENLKNKITGQERGKPDAQVSPVVEKLSNLI